MYGYYYYIIKNAVSESVLNIQNISCMDFYLAIFLSDNLTIQYIISTIIGVAYYIIDNITSVADTMGMYNFDDFGTKNLYHYIFQ